MSTFFNMIKIKKIIIQNLRKIKVKGIVEL